jgi:bifunctional non-homologous end joining protein LigD
LDFLACPSWAIPLVASDYWLIGWQSRWQDQLLPISLPMPPYLARRSIQPCLPRPATEPPAGQGWLHEIKHDGFRILARRDANGVRLFTRNGYNFADRFPRIVEAIVNLPVRSCFIDGEAIVVDERGLSVFDLIRYRQHDAAAVLCAFDLIELDGEDMRPSPIEDRKTTLAELLHKKIDGIALNAHYEGDGAIIYKHACALGCEGIVSKRLGSPYRSGRSDHWLKIKNPAAPAVKREAEEDWGGKGKGA